MGKTIHLDKDKAETENQEALGTPFQELLDKMIGAPDDVQQCIFKKLDYKVFCSTIRRRCERTSGISPTDGQVGKIESLYESAAGHKDPRRIDWNILDACIDKAVTAS